MSSWSKLRTATSSPFNARLRRSPCPETTNNVYPAIAVIALPNDWSISMHESVGFRRAGQLREVGWKSGSWLDIGYWQAELDEPSDPPAEVRAFADVGVVRG